MSAGFNPYVEWLAIDCQIRKPNHYDLLGVSREEKDPKQLDSAARAQLAKLNSIDPGSKQQSLDELKAELKQAFAVLACANQRAEYDRWLEANSPPPVVNQAEMLPPSKSKSMESVAKDEALKAADPTSRRPEADLLPPEKVSQSDLLPPGASPGRSASSPPRAKFVAGGQAQVSDLDPPTVHEIPEAKPVAKSQREQNLPAARPIPTAVPVSSVEASSVPVAQPITAGLTDETSGTTGDAGLVNVHDQEGSSSGSRFVLVAIAGLVSLALVAGSVYMMGLFELGPGVAGKQPNEDGDRTAVIKKPDDDLVSDVDGSQTDNSGNSTNVNESENAAGQGGVSNSGDDGNEIDSSSSENEVPEDGSVDSQASENGASEGGSEENGGSGEADGELTWQRPEPKKLLERISRLPINERRRLANQMQLIKDHWLRQDFDDSESYRLESSGPDVLNELRVLNEAVDETSRRLAEFWQQFKRSCEENHGDIQIDERVVGFVEATPDFLILRIAGSNRRYDHRFVPPGIILEIIERNAIDDIPTYRLQKAAYLISNLNERPDLLDDIDKLLSESENDGHDVYSFRLVSQFDYRDVAAPLVRPQYKSLVDLKKLDSAARDALLDTPSGVDGQGIRKLELLMQSGELLELSLLSETALTAEDQYLAHLDVLRQLAIQEGDALLVESLIDLIEDNSDQVPERFRYMSLLQTADNAGQNSELANWYCHAVLRLLRNEEVDLSASRARRLGNEAIKLAKRFSLNAFEIQIQAKIKSR